MTVPGLIVRSQSGFFTVQTDQGQVVCHLRGRLKRAAVGDKNLAVVGDRVRVSLHSGNSGWIEEIEPRRCALVRTAPTPQGDIRQTLLANPDQLVLVFACAQPAPRLRMLDRFLIICEKQGISPLIVANKIDLLDQELARQLFDRYADLGYEVLYTSAVRGDHIDQLRRHLVGKISGLAGPSGVGKTSLLNLLRPGLGLEVGEISHTTRRGRHTTVVRQLFSLPEGGYVADLPGLRSLALWDIQPHELDGYFPEMRDLVVACQFNNCTHREEPGCAVRAAVDCKKIHPARYESYLRLWAGDADD